MSRRIALFLYGLTQGGVPRRTVSLARALAEAGDSVDIVTLAEGNEAGDLGTDLRHVVLGDWRIRLPLVRRKRRHQFALMRSSLSAYFDRSKPDVVISADSYANLCTLAARTKARHQPAVILTQRTHTSTYAARKPQLIERLRAEYPSANAVVAVSQGVADDLLTIGLSPALVRTIYNPVVDESSSLRAALAVSDAWFAGDQAPLIVAAGRLEPQKDFPCLIRAFAHLRKRGYPHRLVILGDGSATSQAKLIELATAEGVGKYFRLIGHVAPIEPYLARAALFVLSSRFEGLPGVVIEALACGTPVVSTDCPSGPREILLGGLLGRLTPVGDDKALAEAMAATLDAPGDAAKRRERAADFSVSNARTQYTRLIEQVISEQLARSA